MRFFLRRTTAGSGFFAFLGSGFAQLFGHIVPIRVNTLGNTILVGLRYIKKGKWRHFRLPSEAQKHLCLNSLITVKGIQ